MLNLKLINFPLRTVRVIDIVIDYVSVVVVNQSNYFVLNVIVGYK